MDRVLVDHLSTWQYVYDQLGINNDESFALYNQGLLDEWDWIKLDLALIKSAPGGNITDERLRSLMEGMPMMKGWRILIQHLLDHHVNVAIVSGGLQKTARDIAAAFPSAEPWRRRWGGIDQHTAREQSEGFDSKLHVFTNGWLMETYDGASPAGIGDFGRYQVQMNGKGAIVKMLQRRLGVSKEATASVGDSMGDVGMFGESGCAILFNPWDDRPREYANHVIEEKDLLIVLDLICDQFGLPKP
jgi:phosphoserine phosphatase